MKNKPPIFPPIFFYILVIIICIILAVIGFHIWKLVIESDLPLWLKFLLS
jgi:hypothetical protein